MNTTYVNTEDCNALQCRHLHGRDQRDERRRRRRRGIWRETEASTCRSIPEKKQRSIFRAKADESDFENFEAMESVFLSSEKKPTPRFHFSEYINNSYFGK